MKVDMKKILWLAVLLMVLTSCLNIGKNSDEAKVVDDTLRNKLYTVATPHQYTCWPRIGKIGDMLVNVYVKALEHNDPHDVWAFFQIRTLTTKCIEQPTE